MHRDYEHQVRSHIGVILGKWGKGWDVDYGGLRGVMFWLREALLTEINLGHLGMCDVNKAQGYRTERVRL